MLYNKFNLFLASILAIMLFFTLPGNNDWIYSKVIRYATAIPGQLQNMGEEERKSERYGKSYDIFNLTKQRFGQEPGVVLLLPPNDCMKAMKVDDAEMPEPSIFYYFTGVNAVNVGSGHVEDANWALVPKDGNMMVKKIRSKPQLDSLIAAFRKYSR